MNKPTDEAKRLSYEIADEYLPDTHVNGMDCPNTQLADEIVNKVLDVFDQKMGEIPLRDDFGLAELAYDFKKELKQKLDKLRP